MDDLALAHHLADQADAVALRHFAAGDMSEDIKSDGTLVTAADREVEDCLRWCLRRLRPVTRSSAKNAERMATATAGGSLMPSTEPRASLQVSPSGEL